MSKVNIYDGYSDLFFTYEYSYNDAGNIILEEYTCIYDGSQNSKCHNFSYAYSPNGDSKLMSFSVSSSDYLSENDVIADYALEYDSSGKLCKSIISYSDEDFSTETYTYTYHHTAIDVTDKTTLFLSDGNQYCDPFFGIYCIEGFADANF